MLEPKRVYIICLISNIVITTLFGINDIIIDGMLFGDMLLLRGLAFSMSILLSIAFVELYYRKKYDNENIDKDYSEISELMGE